MTRHILLLRHGQTDANAAGIIQGHLPTRLNPLGQSQAARLAQRLRFYAPPVVRLVSSDLKRALESAEPISQSLGLSIEIDPAFRERAYGALEGVDPECRQALRRTKDDEALGAEPAASFEDRIARALSLLTTSGLTQSGHATTADEPLAIAVMTHGGVIRRVLRLLHESRLPSHGALPPLMPVLNASIFDLVWDGARFSCAAFNDAEHLSEAERGAADFE
jgi:probable phosphoglycerate mutase